MTRHDRPDPTCAGMREAISARADGASTSGLPDPLDHVRRCAGCAAFAVDLDDGGQLDGLVHAARAEAPDRTASLLAALAEHATDVVDERLQQVRWLLAGAGAVMLALAVPALLGLGEVQLGDVLLRDLGVHAARDAAVFQAAVGVGFLAVSRRPGRAAGLFPVVAMLAVLTTITMAADLASGAATVGQEVTHLVELVGCGLLWLVARGQAEPRSVAAPAI